MTTQISTIITPEVFTHHQAQIKVLDGLPCTQVAEFIKTYNTFPAVQVGDIRGKHDYAQIIGPDSFSASSLLIRESQNSLTASGIMHVQDLPLAVDLKHLVDLPAVVSFDNGIYHYVYADSRQDADVLGRVGVNLPDQTKDDGLFPFKQVQKLLSPFVDPALVIGVHGDVDEILNLPITQLLMNDYLRQVLFINDIYTLGQVLQLAFVDKENIPGVGKKILKYLNSFLSANSRLISLVPDNWKPTSGTWKLRYQPQQSEQLQAKLDIQLDQMPYFCNMQYVIIALQRIGCFHLGDVARLSFVAMIESTGMNLREALALKRNLLDYYDLSMGLSIDWWQPPENDVPVIDKTKLNITVDQLTYRRDVKDYLNAHGFEYVGQIIELSISAFARRVGSSMARSVWSELYQRGLHFSMDIGDWTPPSKSN